VYDECIAAAKWHQLKHGKRGVMRMANKQAKEALNSLKMEAASDFDVF